MHDDVVLLRQTADDEEAEQTTRCFIESGRVVDALVELDEVVGIHTKTFIEHLDLDTFKRFLSRDRHRFRRLRELRRVVEQLGEQVSQIRDDVPVEKRVGKLANLYTFEQLNLGEGGTKDVFESHRSTPLAWGPVAREHEQTFSIPTHSSRQMVELVQAGEHFGVLHILLEPGDEVDHPVVELLVPTPETHKHFSDVATASGLVRCHLDRCLLNRVECVDERADLVV